MPDSALRRAALAALVAVCLLSRPALDLAASHATARAETDDAPLVFAYYYIWFTEASWARAKTDLPLLGEYASDDRAVIRQHVRWARDAGIDGLIVSWKHVGRLDAPLSILVDEARAEGLNLILLYEGLDFERNPIAVSQVANDLEWFAATYASDPVFDVFGRPAVVWSGTWKFKDDDIASVRDAIGPDRLLVLGSEKDAESYAARSNLLDGDAYYWSSANPRVTPGYRDRLSSLAAAVHADAGIWIAPAAPGFDARLVGGSSVVQRDDGATYRASWEGAAGTAPDAIGIISWNEFSENSHIEPSREHGSRYLELTAELIEELPGHAAVERPTFTQPPSDPSATATAPSFTEPEPSVVGGSDSSADEGQTAPQFDVYLSGLAGVALLAGLVVVSRRWKRGERA